jgi:tryptophanyl-tRNA synthetase
LIKFCTSFRERRSKVTDEVLDLFMTPRPLLWRGVRTDTVLALGDKPDESRPLGDDGKTPGSKNQAKKQEKMELAAERKLQKARAKGGTDGAGADTQTLEAVPWSGSALQLGHP